MEEGEKRDLKRGGAEARRRGVLGGRGEVGGQKNGEGL